MAGNSSTTLIPVAEAEIIGSYPSGTLFEADVFYALQLQPRVAGSANASANRSAHVNNAPAFIAGRSSATLRTNVSSQSTSTVAAPRSRPSGKRRFKPTLNCYQCVLRKTKCDRARPSCRACISRAQSCSYNQLAELLHAHNPPGRKRKRLKSLERDHGEDEGDAGPSLESNNGDGPNLSLDQAGPTTRSEAAFALTLPVPLPDLPFVALGDPAANDCNIPFDPPFAATCAIDTSTPGSNQTSGLGQDSHKFGHISDKIPGFDTSTNHWFHSGELADVIQTMLLLRGQADALLDTYCNAFDPVNPILNTIELTRYHSDIWTTTAQERRNLDPVQLALLMAVYACAAQQSSRMADRKIVESCLSACHRALCVSQYLRSHSLQRCQALFLVCQCLINDSREQEAWTLAGLNQRQAISLGLDSRYDPTTEGSSDELWQRAQLWAALIHQDNVLSCILKVRHSIPGAVAHMESMIELPEEAQPESEPSKASCDRQYYMVLNIVAETMGRHHSQKDTSRISMVERSETLSKLQQSLHLFSPPFQDLDSFWVEQQTNSRIARQGIELMCVFHSYMTLALSSTEISTSADDSNNDHQIIDSVHDSLAAFFSLAELAPNVRGSWSSCHTLSYLQALKIGSLLGRASSDAAASSSVRRRDPMLILAKSDFDRFLERFVRMVEDYGGDGIQSERLRELRELRRKIRVV